MRAPSNGDRNGRPRHIVQSKSENESLRATDPITRCEGVSSYPAQHHNHAKSSVCSSALDKDRFQGIRLTATAEAV